MASSLSSVYYTALSVLCIQGISTGKYHAGVLTNCEDCQKAIFDAGRTSGDLNFPLPFCPELHFSEFKSSVADMKNSVAVSEMGDLVQLESRMDILVPVTCGYEPLL